MGKYIIFLIESLNTLMCIYYGHEQCLVCYKNGLRTDNLLLVLSVLMKRGRKIMIQSISLVRNLLILMHCFIMLKDRTIKIYPDSKQLMQFYHRIILLPHARECANSVPFSKTHDWLPSIFCHRPKSTIFDFDATSYSYHC